MDGFERRKARNKGSILRTVEALIKKTDVSKISVNDIALKSGVSPVTIYNLFGSRDQLIYACIEVIMNRTMDHLRSIANDNKSYHEKIEDIFQWSMGMVDSLPKNANLGLLRDTHLQSLINSGQEDRIKLMMKVINEGKDQGFVNPDLSDYAIRVYLEILTQGIEVDPDLHSRLYYNPGLLHDVILIMLCGLKK